MRYNDLGAQIRAARSARGLTQDDLAERSGTSRSTIARFESGADQDCRIGTISRLCEALGLELNATPSGGREDLEARLESRARHAALAVRLLTGGSPRALID